MELFIRTNITFLPFLGHRIWTPSVLFSLNNFQLMEKNRQVKTTIGWGDYKTIGFWWDLRSDEVRASLRQGRYLQESHLEHISRALANSNLYTILLVFGYRVLIANLYFRSQFLIEPALDTLRDRQWVRQKAQSLLIKTIYIIVVLSSWGDHNLGCNSRQILGPNLAR